jgi:hypothetical protein
MKIHYLYIFLLLVAFSSPAYASLDEGLVIYFSFDNIDGNSVKNGGKPDINGILEADAKQVEGYAGMGVALNIDAAEGTPGDDFVRVSNTPEVNINKEFTIAMWAKGTNFGAYHTLISKADGGAYTFSVENANLSAWVHVNGDYIHPVGTTKLQEDKWYHLTLTYDGVDAAVYVNGEEEARATRGAGDVTLNDSDFMIGAEPSGKNLDPSWPAWHGTLDEFYFYDRALAKDEINLLIKQASAVESADKLSVTWGELKK